MPNAEISTPPPTSPPSSSLPPSPSALPSWAESLISRAPAIAVVLVVGVPIGRLLPELLSVWRVTKDWQPLTAALAALGLIAAPAPTLELVKWTIGRLLPQRKE